MNVSFLRLIIESYVALHYYTKKKAQCVVHKQKAVPKTPILIVLTE